RHNRSGRGRRSAMCSCSSESRRSVHAQPRGDVTVPSVPAAYARILQQSQAIAFGMNSDALTGSLLRTLVASKPGGTFLELGTGCGLGTSWMVDGMDASATLTSVDTNPVAQAIAPDALEPDARRRPVLEDGSAFPANATAAFE